METRTPRHRAQPPFQRRGTRLLLGSIAAVVLTVASVAIGRWAGWFGDDAVVVAPVPTAATGLTAGEQTYYEYVAPRLHEMGAQARELARLGEEHSRNIFDLQAHAGRLTELSEEVDGFLLVNGTPDRFAPVEVAYRDGVRIVDRAKEEAERAILSADWERLGRVVAVFVAGADDLELATALLDVAVGMATPEPGPGLP